MLGSEPWHSAPGISRNHDGDAISRVRYTIGELTASRFLATSTSEIADATEMSHQRVEILKKAVRLAIQPAGRLARA